MNGLPTAKKSMGQHWLQDKAVLEDIADSVPLSKKDTVVEVGPGTGTLTAELAKRAGNVIAIEYDEGLLKTLFGKFKDTNVQIVYADILKYDFSLLPNGYKVVANIPYYLTSHLLRRLCEQENAPAEIALLMQKEVAERVAALPGQASILSTIVQLFYEPKLGIIVGPEHFTPPPKVDSQLLILHKRPKPLFDVDQSRFFTLVKAGFSEKRKKLRSSLAGGMSIGKDEAERMLGAAGIDPNSRAQQLSLEQWHNLYKIVYQ